MAAESTGDRGRLLSLDAFRGLTILGMILVNNPGTWGALYWPFGHAQWHGWTPTDLVFPFFLFIVGTSLAYSLRKYLVDGSATRIVYLRIARRTAILIVIGLLLNHADALLEFAIGRTETLQLATWRWPGVLQRIALVYCVISILVLHVGIRGQAALATMLLLGYWALLAWIPLTGTYEANLSPGGNIAGVIDRAVFGEAHMYTQATSEPTEPEGILSTLPSIVTALLGYWTGLAVQRRGCNIRTVAWLMACGAAAAAVALIWNEAFPINKKLWTSSFVLLTGGLAMIVFAATMLKFDIWGWRRLARPFEIVGQNAIFAYAASQLGATLLDVTRVGGISTKEWLYENLFASWIGEPKLASLGFAVATVIFWWLVLWGLARRGWTIRV